MSGNNESTEPLNPPLVPQQESPSPLNPESSNTEPSPEELRKREKEGHKAECRWRRTILQPFRPIRATFSFICDPWSTLHPDDPGSLYVHSKDASSSALCVEMCCAPLMCCWFAMACPFFVVLTPFFYACSNCERRRLRKKGWGEEEWKKWREEKFRNRRYAHGGGGYGVYGGGCGGDSGGADCGGCDGC
ncbi:hypothetical protein BDV96DRAFT_33513 [Lophiotrema nucula]|uniref:Uncharacterized protein n=1 Tax=Lophiotrema nucula TaxID=690887 RepID=A0A6A5ZCR1_9PLEO|nr:hypothetical protein BDV96DRAFT_33513 [Lophiotrema nucula]